MIRSIVVVGAAVLFGAVGCDKSAQHDQEQAVQAQREADEKVAQAQKESQTKITSAQLEANKQTVEAQSDFAKLREDYRHKMQTDFDGVNARIAKLEAKETTLAGKAKTDLDVKLDDVHAKRDAWRATMTSLDGATMATWDAAKARSDNAWSDLKTSVDKAAPSTL